MVNFEVRLPEFLFVEELFGEVALSQFHLKAILTKHILLNNYINMFKGLFNCKYEIKLN